MTDCLQDTENALDGFPAEKKAKMEKTDLSIHLNDSTNSNKSVSVEYIGTFKKT